MQPQIQLNNADVIHKFVAESDEDFLKEFGDNEVTIPDTINDKGVDLAGGLMDQAIFGCKKNLTCRCGELHGLYNENVLCEDCKVTVTKKALRTRLFGYFKTHVAMINPLFEDDYFTKVLKLKKKDIEKFYGPNDIFFTPDSKGTLKFKIDGEEVIGKITFNAGVHKIGVGIESIPTIINSYVRDFKVHVYFVDKPELYNFLATNPASSIVRVIPVGYREVHQINNGNVVDTLNILYKMIMSSAIRVRTFKENNPNYLYSASYWHCVNALHNEYSGLMLNGGFKFKSVPIKDYPKIMNKKNGLIRGNMLAKRGYFSGRSVNSSPHPGLIDISEDEALLPMQLAKNMLRLNITKILCAEYGCSIQNAMERISNLDETVMKILHDFDGQFYVYITRAPALYKFSFMAFKMRINFDLEDKTIKIHPLQNAMYNLDYDGDTQATMIPITFQAQNEAKNKALPSKTPFYDRDGSPIYEFGLEFVYGLFYMTEAKYGRLIGTFDGPSYECDYEELDGIKVTIGSRKIKDVFDKHGVKGYELGQNLNKKVLKKITSQILRSKDHEFKDALKVLSEMTLLSTEAFSESGLSIKFNDFVEIDKTKLKSLDKIIDYIIEEELLIKQLEKSAPVDNAFMAMVNSGTKGNHTQIKQIMISKGVLVDGNGNYLPPIKNSLSDGLTADEFVTTIAAGRRGMVSKSLSTADTGYFYYRLVKSMRDIRIDMDDCGSLDKGIMTKLSDTEGRHLAEFVGRLSPNHLMTDEDINSSINYFGEDKLVKLRSPITCTSTEGVCKKCYGNHISSNRPSVVGDNIGVITGSTMSEVMSQAMLRNFHTAGSTDILKMVIPSIFDVDKLEVEVLKDHTKIQLNNLEYLIPTSRLSISKTESIKAGEDVFSYDLSNNDVNRQFDKLERILDMMKTADPAVISPISGIMTLGGVVDKTVYELNKTLNIDLPRKVRHIDVVVTGDDGKSVTLKVGYKKMLLIPFGKRVEKGDILTEGDINYRKFVTFHSKERVIDSLLKDFKDIYTSQGAYLKPIHFEMLVNHLMTIIDDVTFKLEGITSKGLGRSYAQHLSLGWMKKAIPHILDELSELGNTNADRIILGTYK